MTIEYVFVHHCGDVPRSAAFCPHCGEESPHLEYVCALIERLMAETTPRLALPPCEPSA
jgi:hypothetical protein